MNVGMIFLCATVLSLGVVNTIKDLNDPIRYVDKAQSYFIGIKGNIYRMGTAVDAIRNPNEDMPQFSGNVENCSSHRIACRSIAYLKFILPHNRAGSATYDVGAKITVRQLINGEVHASAICPAVSPSGCTSRADGGGPVVTYQYEVNRLGILTMIKIQHWNDQKVQVDQENLVLVSRRGLKLD